MCTQSRYGSDAELEQGAARLDGLLEALKEVCAPSIWAQIEELTVTLASLYGEGLARLVDLARAAAKEQRVLDERLAFDPLLSGLLSLHGLHPLGVRERVDRILRAIEYGYPEPGARVEVIDIEGGVVRLRLVGNASAATTKALARLAVRGVTEAAPEIEEVVFVDEGPEATPFLGDGLGINAFGGPFRAPLARRGDEQ